MCVSPNSYNHGSARDLNNNSCLPSHRSAYDSPSHRQLTPASSHVKLYMDSVYIYTITTRKLDAQTRHSIHISCHPLVSAVFTRATLCERARVLAIVLCLCLSRVGVLSKRFNESGWVLARELLSTYHTLCCCNEIQAPSKIRVRHSISIVEACYHAT